MKKTFLTGLVTLLPLAVTVIVVVYVVNLLTRPFMGIATQALIYFSIHLFGMIPSEKFIRTISQISILIGLFLFTLLLGVIGRRFFFDVFLKAGEKLVRRIPLVGKIYKTTKDIIQTLFAGNSKSFQQVVMVRFPNPRCYCLGLVTRDAPNTCQNALSDETLISVFVPTTPNPMTGFMVMRRKSDLIYLDMHGEDAIKYVVSVAVVPPESRP